MADSKLSELTPATSVGASDSTYLVQSNVSKKVDIATLFGNLPVPIGATGLSLTTNETLTAGSISLSTGVSKLVGGASNISYALPDGTDGLVKVLVVSAYSTGNIIITGNFKGISTIVMTALGDTATLIYISDAWYLLAGRCSIT